jgi:hypothetical protein
VFFNTRDPNDPRFKRVIINIFFLSVRLRTPAWIPFLSVRPRESRIQNVGYPYGQPVGYPYCHRALGSHVSGLSLGYPICQRDLGSHESESRLGYPIGQRDLGSHESESRLGYPNGHRDLGSHESGTSDTLTVSQSDTLTVSAT